MSHNEDITELSEAARRAGHIVTDQIDSIIERAEQQAEMILRQAERDAEDTRREAVAAGKRLLDRIHALEFPLGELVVSLRDEMDRVARELEAGPHVDSDATALPAAPESERPHPEDEGFYDDSPVAEPESEREPESEQDREPGPQPEPEPSPRSDRARRSHDEANYEEEPAVDSVRSRESSRPPRPKAQRKAARPATRAADTEEDGKATRLARRRARPKGKGGIFITTEGHCSVCHRSFKAGSAAALAKSGWRVNGDVGLCPDCQADRWELPDGARLPVRPGGS